MQSDEDVPAALSLSPLPRVVPPAQAEQRIFVHGMRMTPDATGRRRPVLVVDFAPAPR